MTKSLYNDYAQGFYISVIHNIMICLRSIVIIDVLMATYIPIIDIVYFLYSLLIKKSCRYCISFTSFAWVEH